jgi:lysophospholipase L1-like esterase
MTGRKFYGQPSDVVGSKEYALVITNMKKTLTVYVFLSIAPCVIFLILHVLYRPSVRLTVLYAAVSILGALLIFFGTYGKITLFTLYVILIGQPFIAHFFVVDFHTLRPNFSAVKTNDVGLLRGLDRQITVTTDSNGFRTSTADAYNKKFKIFLVGGSTVEQIDLDDRKTTSASLERGIGNSDYSVINTGVSGLRTVNHVATINAIKRFEPYLIIIQLGVNDWGCALKDTCKRSPLDPRNWPISLAAFSMTNLLRSWGTWWSNAIDFRAVMGHYEEKRKTVLSDSRLSEYLRFFHYDFAELLRTCETIAATCVITTQPTSYKSENFEDPKFLQSLWMTPPLEDWALTENSLIKISTAYNNHIRNNTSCANCLLFDLDLLMRGKRSFFFDDVHFTNEGAKFFAEELLGFMRTHGLVKVLQ